MSSHEHPPSTTKNNSKQVSQPYIKDSFKRRRHEDNSSKNFAKSGHPGSPPQKNNTLSLDQLDDSTNKTKQTNDAIMHISTENSHGDTTKQNNNTDMEINMQVSTQLMDNTELNIEQAHRDFTIQLDDIVLEDNTTTTVLEQQQSTHTPLSYSEVTSKYRPNIKYMEEDLEDK
jgi:hypothetical protein